MALMPLHPTAHFANIYHLVISARRHLAKRFLPARARRLGISDDQTPALRLNLYFILQVTGIQQRLRDGYRRGTAELNDLRFHAEENIAQTKWVKPGIRSDEF